MMFQKMNYRGGICDLCEKFVNLNTHNCTTNTFQPSILSGTLTLSDVNIPCIVVPLSLTMEIYAELKIQGYEELAEKLKKCATGESK